MPNQVLGRVKSETHPGLEYVISQTPGGNIVCTCKAFQFSKTVPRICKHIEGFAPVEPERKPFHQVMERAVKVADELQPYCDGLMITGSLRRRKPTCKDIDIVACIQDKAKALEHLNRISEVHVAPATWTLTIDGIKAEIYQPEIQEHFWPLVLWRTGSATHNIKVAQAARKLGLEMTKEGIKKEGKVIAWQSEREMFNAVGMHYRAPWQRE